jgi:hypothetical protein
MFGLSRASSKIVNILCVGKKFYSLYINCSSCLIRTIVSWHVLRQFQNHRERLIRNTRCLPRLKFWSHNTLNIDA